MNCPDCGQLFNLEGFTGLCPYCKARIYLNLKIISRQDFEIEMKEGK